MQTATASLYFDKYHPKRNGKCSVKIKVTFKRQRQYYKTGIDLTPEQFERVLNARRRTEYEKELHVKLMHYLSKAQNVIEQIRIFTFEIFEVNFFETRNAYESVSLAFDNYIKQLRNENRLSSAESYSNAKSSLGAYKKKLTFVQVTPEFLRSYETHMLNNGKSITTVGMYLRNLRSIFNIREIDQSVYPFGSKNGKYRIPEAKNIKKALSINDIKSIFEYQAIPNTTEEMTRDYWIFLYMCNGMNVKDFCLLKWKNIDGNILKYERAKTQRSQKQHESIIVSLKPEALEIIKKWGQPAISKDSFVFPHIKPGMTEEQQRKTLKQLTKLINKYMKLIARKLGINKEVTTYAARHSFATILKRSGTPLAMISDLMGHSSTNITESYLDGFENDKIHEATDALTEFKKAR